MANPTNYHIIGHEEALIIGHFSKDTGHAVAGAFATEYVPKENEIRLHAQYPFKKPTVNNINFTPGSDEANSIFKANKHNDPNLSVLEVGISAVFESILKNLTSQNDLVIEKNPNQPDKVVGVLSKKLPFFHDLSDPDNRRMLEEIHSRANQTENQWLTVNAARTDDVAKAIDFEEFKQKREKAIKQLKKLSISIARILVTSHVLEEDDLHTKNIAFVIDNVGDPQFVKIDHDLGFYDKISSVSGNRRKEHPGDERFKITTRDIKKFPYLKDADPHYWPNKYRIMAKGTKQWKDEANLFLTNFVGSEESDIGNESNIFSIAKYKAYWDFINQDQEEVRNKIIDRLGGKFPEKVNQIMGAFIARQAEVRVQLLTMPEFYQNLEKFRELEDQPENYRIESTNKLVNQLHTAGLIKSKHLGGRVTNLIWQEAEPNIGNTPLHIAVLTNCLQFLKISSYAKDINTFNAQGKTPLMLAIEQGDYYAVKQLLDAGARPDIKRNQQDPNDKNAYQLALELNLDSENDHDMGRKVLAEVHKAVVEYQEGVGSMSYKDTTPLHLAAANDFVPKNLSALKNYHNYLHAYNVEGHNPLMVAIFKGNIEAIRILLEAGANPKHRKVTYTPQNTIKSQGLNALQVAEQLNSDKKNEIINMLNEAVLRQAPIVLAPASMFAPQPQPPPSHPVTLVSGLRLPLREETAYMKAFNDLTSKKTQIQPQPNIFSAFFGGPRSMAPEISWQDKLAAIRDNYLLSLEQQKKLAIRLVKLFLQEEKEPQKILNFFQIINSPQFEFIKQLTSRGFLTRIFRGSHGVTSTFLTIEKAFEAKAIRLRNFRSNDVAVIKKLEHALSDSLGRGVASAFTDIKKEDEADLDLNQPSSSVRDTPRP